MSYQLLASGIVVRLSDGAQIPADQNNRDYRAYLAWVAQGNTPEELAPNSAPPDVLTPAQFWMQLAIDGDEAAALAIIDTLPRVQQILALRARDYRRDNELLIQLATALQKNSDDIDTFFREANEL